MNKNKLDPNHSVQIPMSRGAVEVDERCKDCSAAEIASRLTSLSDQELVELLDSQNARVGDISANVLVDRQKHQAVIDALLRETLTTARGRVRATNVLTPFGKRIPRAEAVYLALVDDPSDKVVDNALFGLVMMQSDAGIHKIEEAKKKTAKSSSRALRYELAMQAIRAKQPSIFAPFFCDVDDVWKSDESGLSRGSPGS